MAEVLVLTPSEAMPLLALLPMATTILGVELAYPHQIVTTIPDMVLLEEASTPVEVTTILYIPTSQVRGFVRDSQVEVPIPPLMETEDLEEDRLETTTMALVAGATPVAVEMTQQPTEEPVPTMQAVTNPTVLILLVV